MGGGARVSVKPTTILKPLDLPDGI